MGVLSFHAHITSLHESKLAVAFDSNQSNYSSSGHRYTALGGNNRYYPNNHGKEYHSILHAGLHFNL